MMSRLCSLITALVVTMSLTACKGDPQAEAREHLEKGNQQASAKRYAEAIIEYRRAVQADPRLGQARLQLAHAYASTGDGINALREYARAADLLPEDNDAQKRAGVFMLLANQFQDAQGLADRMLERNPSNIDAMILKANALAGLKDVDGAVEAFEKAVELDPNRSTTYAEFGALRMTTGDREAAEAAFLKAVETDPQSVAAHLALANFYLATRRLPEAEKQITRAIEIEPKDVTANRAMAMYYLMTNKGAAAEPHLRLVAEVSPGPEAKHFLSEYLIRLNRFDEAREILKPLLADNASFVGASVRIARIDVLAGKHADAHRMLESALAREANNIEALVTLARLHLKENNSINALTTLERAVKADPNSVPAQLALAQTYEARGSLKEAATAYNDALKVDGRSLEGRIGLARVQINNGQAADAVPMALKLVSDHPSHPEARLILLHGLIAVGDTIQADHQLGVLMKSFPDNTAVQNAAGMLATVKNDVAGARAAYSRALQSDPRSYQALAGLLSAEMNGKQFGNAKALIEKQLAERPDDPNVLMMAAQTYNAIGDAFEMEKALKKTVEVDPQSLQAYAMLGKMYYQQGRLDLARRELETYVNRAPNSVPANTMLGTILQLQGKHDDAKERYGKALQVDPRAAVAANNLAWIDANSNGNLDMALQLAQAAKARLPNRHEIDDTLGVIYYKKGLSSQAVEALTSSVQKQPDNPAYNYHLALALNQSGNKAEARKHLEKALKSNATFEGLEDAKKLLETLSAAGGNER